MSFSYGQSFPKTKQWATPLSGILGGWAGLRDKKETVWRLVGIQIVAARVDAPACAIKPVVCP
jgi:hypothetical protein